MTFAFIGGDVALDFTGTVEHRRADATDLLGTPDDLANWLTEAGVVDTHVTISNSEFATAVRLREAIYRMACATRDRAQLSSTDRRLVNQTAKDMPVRVRLAKNGSITRSGDASAAIATIARSAIELLTGDFAYAIKECDTDECTRLYVDNSRRGSRRWCDMRDCGNRAKVASFRARHS